MRIALTGVSGFIGSAVARYLHGIGHEITGLVRESSRREHIEPLISRFVVGDHADESCWEELLDGAECVVHNSVNWKPLKANPADFAEHMRSNLDASLKLLHTSAPRQFIFISTIAVHHNMMPRKAAPDGTNLVTEDHPLRPASLYGAYKATVEAHLWAEHFATGRHTSAIRPCAVYGIDPLLKRSHGYNIIKQLREAGRFDTPAGGKYIHVEDVAAVVAAMVGNPVVAGKPFNLVDCYARHADWAVMAAEVLGINAHIDTTSPTLPANSFSKDAVHALGITIDRGHDGIRDHLRQLAREMDAS